jgi:hypothetical protein
MTEFPPLIILKQLLLIASLQIKGHRISPLECHSALLNFVHGFLHELYLDPGKIRGYLHLFHLLLRLGVKVEGQFSRLFVVRPTIVILRTENQNRWRMMSCATYVEVSFERSTALGLLITSIDASFLFVPITRVPRSSMFRPRACHRRSYQSPGTYKGKRSLTHTDPTKLMPTFLTSHMAFPQLVHHTIN